MKQMCIRLILCAFSLAGWGARAGLVCEEPVYDYGTVAASNGVEHSFLLTNTGTEPVKILKLRKTCGCVATVASKMDVEPGGSAEIQVRVSLKGRSGAQSKTVYVQTNSRESQILKLEVRGMVLRAETGPVQTRAAVPRPVVPRPAAPQPVAAPVTTSRVLTGPLAVPAVIRLPRTVGPEGVTVRVQIQFPEASGVRLKGVLPPADISFAVQRGNDACWIELGPIRDVQALKGAALVVLTTSGSVRVPCIVEE